MHPEAGFQRAIPIGRLGRGGMADVLLAVRYGVDGAKRLVVIKRPRESFAGDRAFMAMLVDEARLAAQLSHPNIVQSYEMTYDEEGVAQLEMEFLDGQPLNRLAFGMRESGRRFSPTLAATIVSEMLKGLHHAHELCDCRGAPMGVVHRDVSPHNVFLTYAGQVKIVDFGIAKAVGFSAVSADGSIKGKAHYMAPEQVTGASVDRRVDVFSAGVVLFELIAGRRYWGELVSAEIIHRLARQNLPDPRAVPADVPEGLVRILERALAPDRTLRFASAEEFRRALEDHALSTGSQHAVERLLMEVFESERAIVQAKIDQAIASLEDGSIADLDASAAGAPQPPEPLPETLPPSLPSVADDDPDDRPTSVGPMVRRGPNRTALVCSCAALLVMVGAALALVCTRMPTRASMAPTTSATPPVR